MLCSVGLLCVFGLKRAGFSGAGVLSCLIMATVAAQRWSSKVSFFLKLITTIEICVSSYNRTLSYQDKAHIATSLQHLWWVGEALLFSLVGAQVDFSFITGKLVGKIS